MQHIQRNGNKQYAQTEKENSDNKAEGNAETYKQRDSDIHNT